MSWEILVCPHCEKSTLPPGAYRMKCGHCGTNFSANTDDPENPLTRQRPRHFVRGKTVRVVRDRFTSSGDVNDWPNWSQSKAPRPIA